MDMPGYVVLSRLAAQQRATDAMAANIANADTPGYKATELLFGQFLEKQSQVAAPRGGREVAFAQDRATWRDFTAGSLQATGNPLDIAISGPGFFAVRTENGERYTRAGRFALSPDSEVVDIAGNPVLTEDGAPLAIPPGASRIEIAGDGAVRTEQGPVGRLRLVTFADPQKLTAEGSRLYASPDDMPAEPVERPAMVQGSVEGSNVQPIIELTRLTAGLREFQFASQFLETEGDRVKDAVGRILKRPS
ncbi:flagellar basal-body rod protein FlgF [Roseomonas sp. GC11]|uniref:flagellar basal-body rod protein FlgF n=1 Tax=Roseomonas sp. GC11 TaxID=2950546 RepID=UPI00210AF6D2|nr:flagellar basal-body rod protein FlgF [Roseomonas sp. GC11]MCQ4162272.1 flagellar basal-body rod protein FlgF [Roseomonas sp. GC11]